MKRTTGIQGISSRLLRIFSVAASVLVLAWTGAAASEVYTWTDENGVVHFGDAPPESGESRKIVVPGVYRPGSSGAYPTSSDSKAKPASTTAAVAEGNGAEPPKSAAQQRREKMAKDREERTKEQAETERLCGLHKQRLEQVEPARRVFYTNEKGEPVRMDDEQRVRLVEESRDFLEKNCG